MNRNFSLEIDMPIDIAKMRDPKIAFPEYNNADFAPLSEYLEIARKCIGYFCPRMRGGLAEEMLANDDSVSEVACAIMLGDLRWQEERGEKAVRTKRSYRNAHARYAIQKYMMRQRSEISKGNVSMFDVLPEAEDEDINPNLEDPKQKTPYQEASYNELINGVYDKISKMVANGTMTKQQASYIEMYYIDSMTLEEIGRKSNITREAVRQNIARGLSKIRKEYGII